MSRGMGKWIAAALLCSACTEVELCYNAEHPHTLPLSIGFNWDEAAVEEKPDSMYMVFSRIINTRHYVYGVSSEGWEEEGEAVPEALSEEPQEESMRVEGGDYIVIAVNKNHEQVELLEADDFQADNSIRLDSLRLQVKDIKTPDLPGFDTQKWNNLNPAYTYIANTGKLFSSVERWGIAAGTSIWMSPQPVTQHLTFRFSLNLEEETDVTVDRVACELSGVVNRISLSTGKISEDDNRHSICFMAEKTEDSEDLSPVYEGSVDVLGLFPNKSQASIYGAGIIQLSIAVSKGKESRIHTVRLNLINLLTPANLVVPAEDMDGLVANPAIREKTFDIGQLEVDFDHIMNGEGNGGTLQWVVIENGGTDIEI